MALELYEVRENMESMAARLAAERATPEILLEMEECLAEQQKIVKEQDAVAYSRSDHRFHLLIYDASGNELLKDILTGLRYKARPLAFKLSPHFSDFLGYHRQILDALRSHNGRAAENAMRQHNRRMIELIKTTPWGVEE
jgi:DNA-binding GntR family transcriptional regulator